MDSDPGAQGGKVKDQNQDFFKKVFISFLTLLNSTRWGCWEYISMYIFLSLMSLVNKKHMLLQLKLQYADFWFTSAIQSP